MTPQWFLKGIIISLIINLMGNYCKATNEEKQENAKYLHGLNLSHSAKDEKAFEMVKDRIKDVLEQVEGRTFNNAPSSHGPRKYFYNKYMKLGNTRDESMDYDTKKIQNPSQYHFNNFKEKFIKYSQQELSPIAKKETIEDNKLNEYPRVDKQKIQKQPTILSDRLRNFLSDNTSLEQNFLMNTNPQINEVNTSGINDENIKLIKTYMDQIKNKHSGKYFEKEERKITDYNNKNGIIGIINDYEKGNSSLNSIQRISRSLKGSHLKKKRKCHRADKKTCENRKTHLISMLKPRDHRRVRSCDIKMEDLRESFIPNEQLSIYHPKMSLSDQFILQDTMF